MDIRDFPGDVQYPKCGLTSIFELQKELIGPYIEIEGLPPYPIDINTKKSQNLIKDFSARVTEELGEAWESYEIMMDMKDQGTPKDKLIPHLQNYNEEVADAIHFYVELLIYSNVTPEKVRKFMHPWLGLGASGDILDALMEMGRIWLEQDIRFQKPIPAFWVINNNDLKDEFLRGGRKLGQQHKAMQMELLWETTYYLQIARNTLKNKPWKQSEMMTDETIYETHTIRGFVTMFKFFFFAGFTKESLYTIYYKKNKVNKFRQKSKY